MQMGVVHGIYELLLPFGFLFNDIEWVLVGIVRQGISLINSLSSTYLSVAHRAYRLIWFLRGWPCRSRIHHLYV